MVFMVIKHLYRTFCSNFKKLPVCVKNRLTVENDDKESMYSVKDLIKIYEKIKIPIVLIIIIISFAMVG